MPVVAPGGVPTSTNGNAPVTHLLYLHGFRSSPLSFKAQRMLRWVREEQPELVWACPQLPPSPREAVELIDAAVASWPVANTLVMGSSLGGWYATVQAERLGPSCRAVLLNPAIYPARDLARYIGELSLFHSPDEHFYFKPDYIKELQDLQPGAVSSVQRYCAIIAQGDELLDWREMLARYPGADVKLLPGSDHALSDFEQHLPHILSFAGFARSGGV
ncbi:MAG: esterase [Burkholderiales bacterium]|nr:esterase [Burkholderiales bacterium]